MSFDRAKAALSAHTAGNLALAETLYRHHLQDHPDDALAAYNLGTLLATRGSWGDAIHFFRYALALQPEQPVTHYNLAVAYVHAQRLEDAKACFLRAVALKPDYAAAQLALAGLLHAEGELRSAEDALEIVLAQEPDCVDALYQMAQISWAASNFEQAQHYFERCVELDAAHSEAYYHLGILAYQQDFHQDALLCFEQAIRFQPEDVQSWFHRGLCHKSLHNDAQARDAFQRVLEMEPEHPGAQHMLKALSGAQQEEVCPRFVESLFDYYAPFYERHMSERLSYTLPSHIAALLAELEHTTAEPSLLDLGCGTGLVGKALSSERWIMDGIDLSAQMLEQARGAYRHLFQDDIRSLDSKKLPQRYHVVVALEVLGYIRDLAPLFQRVHACLLQGGCWIFSTEVQEGTHESVLQRTGRYAHHPQHVVEQLLGAGFDIKQNHQVALREDQGEGVEARLFMAQAKA